jgi:hypothetical protein
LGTISTKKLAGMSLMLGPAITLVCYFIQQLSVFANAKEGDASSFAVAAAEGGVVTIATAIIIPLSLMMMVYGMFYIANGIRENGNGDALVRYAIPLLLVGFTGFVLSSGIMVSVTNSPAPAAAAEAAMLAASGINSVGGIFFSLGAAALFFAMASRDEYNKTLATVAGFIGLLAFVFSITGFSSTELSEVMTPLVGVTYIFHSIYAIYLGRRFFAKG